MILERVLHVRERRAPKTESIDEDQPVRLRQRIEGALPEMCRGRQDGEAEPTTLPPPRRVPRCREVGGWLLELHQANAPPACLRTDRRRTRPVPRRGVPPPGGASSVLSTRQAPWSPSAQNGGRGPQPASHVAPLVELSETGRLAPSLRFGTKLPWRSTLRTERGVAFWKGIKNRGRHSHIDLLRMPVNPAPAADA